MDFTAYITLCLILVAPSCHSTREERSPRGGGWKAVDKKDQATYNYLALLQYGPARSAQYCSGSITSRSTVLTYCSGNATTAYGGLHNVAATNKTETQKRDVTEVVPHPNLTDLKICKVANWELKENVGLITLDLTGKGSTSYDTCLVLGFGGAEGALHKLENQKIGPKAECNAPERTTDGVLYSKVETVATHQLQPQDYGGPAVCDNIQRGINKAFQAENTGAKTTACNLFVDITKYSPWIKENTPQDSGENQGPNGNNTVASTGSSIHGYMKKNSEWKVLGFITSAIVIFLQY